MKVRVRFSGSLPIVLVIGLMGAAVPVCAQSPGGGAGANAATADKLDQASSTDRQDAGALRARADQWNEMRRKAEDRAAKAADPVTKSVWQETAQRHAEEAARLEQQAAELEHRAADESAEAAQERAKVAPPQPPPIVTGASAGAASSPLSPGAPAMTGDLPRAEPSSPSAPNSASPDTATAAANSVSAPTPASFSEADIGGCACPELPALAADKPPTPGHVHDELSEQDLEAMFSNRDQIYSGWATSLDALARDIDPRGSLKIWSSPAPRIVNPDIAIREGGESGIWVGRPLPTANSYVGNRAELMATNPRSWGQTPESLVGPLVATLARTRKYGSPQYGSGQYGYSFRNDLLTISLFLGETLANSEVPGTPLGVNPPSMVSNPAIVPSPVAPAKSPDEVRLGQEAAALRKQAEAARERAKGRDALLQGAKAKLAEVKDHVNQEVWTEIVEGYQEELDRANKEVKDLEDAASEKEAQAATLRAPAPIPPPSADDMRRMRQAKAFGDRFAWGVINSVLRGATPASLRLARSRPHPPGTDPLAYGAWGRKDPDELPLDRFDMANAALDMILWHDSVNKIDTGWLTFNDSQQVETRTLLELAAAGPKFATPGTVVSPQQAAIACKAFSTLVYLADSDAKSGEEFQRAILIASHPFSYTSPENDAQADYSQVALAGRAAIMETGIATPALAQDMAHVFMIEARSNTRDAKNNVIPKLKQAHEFAIETATMLASGSGGVSHKGFRNEFYDAIQKQIPQLEANRANGTGSPEDTDLINKWKGGSLVVVVRMGPTGKVCQALCADCARAIEAEKPTVQPSDFKSKPRIVVSSASNPQRGEVLDSLNRDEPFWIDLWLPTDQKDTSPTVTVHAEGSGKSETLRLKPRGRKPGFVIYSNAPKTITLSEGGEGGGKPWLHKWGRGDMGALKTENGDIVKVSYPGADTVEFQAFDDVVQQTIARSSKDLLAKELYYDALLSDPDVAATRTGAHNVGYYLRLKVRAIANARAIMNYHPRPDQNWFTDLTRANIGVGYLAFVDEDSRSWDSEITSSDDKGAAAGPDGRFGGGVEYVDAAEAAVVRVAIENAQRTQEAATMHHLAVLAIGAYRISLMACCIASGTSFCPEAIWIALTHTTATGEEVDERGVLINDLGIIQPAVTAALSPALARLKAFAVAQFALREGEVLANEARLANEALTIENAAVQGEEVLEARRSAVLAKQSVGELETVERQVAGQTVKFRVDRSLGMPGARMEMPGPAMFAGKEHRIWAKGELYPVQIADDSCRMTVGESFRRRAGLPARSEAANLNIMYERVRFMPRGNRGYTPGQGTERQGFAFFLEGEGFKVDTPKLVNLKDIEQQLAKGMFVEVSVNVGKIPLREALRQGLKVKWHSVSPLKIVNAGGQKLVKYYDAWNGMFGFVDGCRFEAEMNPTSAVIADPSLVRRP